MFIENIYTSSHKSAVYLIHAVSFLSYLSNMSISWNKSKQELTNNLLEHRKEKGVKRKNEWKFSIVDTCIMHPLCKGCRQKAKITFYYHKDRNFGWRLTFMGKQHPQKLTHKNLHWWRICDTNYWGLPSRMKLYPHENLIRKILWPRKFLCLR